MMVPECPRVSPLRPVHEHNGCQNQQYLDYPLFNGKSKGTIKITNENVAELASSSGNIFNLQITSQGCLNKPPQFIKYWKKNILKFILVNFDT
jgi:hypothetical protein